MKGKIFNAQEVQAIISGKKTQFTEVKVQPNSDRNTTPAGFIFTGICGDGAKENSRKCPYQVGQKIFCKESFSMSRGLEYHQCHDAWYWADGNPESGDWTKPKPAQHMKQEHSRLILQIKDIRVERLKYISGEDAINEGFNYGTNLELCQLRFFENWNATHKKPEEKFEANPLVWVISFGVLHASEMFNVSISTKF